MNKPPAVISPNLWITLVVLALVAVAIVAVLSIDRSGDRGSGLPDRFELDVDRYKKIDPALMGYTQTSEIPSGMEEVRAVSVGPEDRIYVAGDKIVRVFDRDGAAQSTIELSDSPYCLAVGTANHAFPGRVYVGMKNRVDLMDASGTTVGTWNVPGERARLTSIALAQNDVFVADAGGRIVLRYDTNGNLLASIGKRDQGRGVPGFAIPSPFFDMAVGAEELLWVVNPAAMRLEAYSFDGQLEYYWGESSSTIEGFFGCCNPANFSLLSDGRFLTAEKGLLRVKVYSADGELDCVVAGPEQLDAPSTISNESLTDQEYTAVDVAADSRGRVLVLDLALGKVRIFEPTEPIQDTE